MLKHKCSLPVYENWESMGNTICIRNEANTASCYIKYNHSFIVTKFSIHGYINHILTKAGDDTFFFFFFRQYFIGFGTSTITYVNHLRMIWLVVLVRSH